MIIRLEAKRSEEKEREDGMENLPVGGKKKEKSLRVPLPTPVAMSFTLERSLFPHCSL